MRNLIPLVKIRSIFNIYQEGEVNIWGISRSLRISRNTVRRYLSDIHDFCSLNPGEKNMAAYISHLKHKSVRARKVHPLFQIFPGVAENIQQHNSNRMIEWTTYKNRFPDGYGYTQFAEQFSRWCSLNNIVLLSNKYKIKSIPDDDLQVFKKWRRGPSKRKWDKAVVLLESLKGAPISKTASKVERSPRKIKRWIKLYETNGLKGLEPRPIKLNKERQENIKIKKANLIKLIHEPPRLHGINRTSWSIKTLNQAYNKFYGVSISKTSISEYIRSEGYRFRKARMTLTSPDPDYREKLKKITNILANLGAHEKFFSIDEFGPFAVKIKGGRSFVRKNELKTYPQIQRSKGRLICTAALELSQNQITSFYSEKKDTEEMIRMIKLLSSKYPNEEKLYISWDAASWHASKKLYKQIDELNNETNKKTSPKIELAPLPASAQFLNVIESVFSGMAKAIIHNSNYQSKEDCMHAIDLYFKERNEYFKSNPKRAGNKIWGEEINTSVFDEAKNFKDPRWR